jgi:hypothetical protein
MAQHMCSWYESLAGEAQEHDDIIRQFAASPAAGTEPQEACDRHLAHALLVESLQSSLQSESLDRTE